MAITVTGWDNANVPMHKFVANYSKTTRSYNTIEAIVEASAKNKKIRVEPDLGTEGGKLRGLKITMYPAVCGNREGSPTADICQPGEKIQPRNEYLQLTQTTASEVMTLTMDDVRKSDDGGYNFSDHAKEYIAAQMPEFRKMLANKMLAYLIPHIGLLPGGQTSMRVPFADTTKGAANYAGPTYVDQVFEDTGFTNRTILAGSSEVFAYINHVKRVAGDADNLQGQMPGMFPTDNMYYDAIVNAAFGDGGQHIIAFDPDAFKFVTWSENAGIFATTPGNLEAMDFIFRNVQGNLVKGILVDPVTGLVYDLNMKFDECTETWNVQYKLKWDIFYFDGLTCNDYNENGIFHFTTCMPKIAPCPDGDNMPTPVAPSTFSWTFPATPTYVDYVQIGNRQVRVQATVTTLADWLAILNAAGIGTFTGATTAVHYVGYQAPSGTYNNGTGSITFA